MQKITISTKIWEVNDGSVDVMNNLIKSTQQFTEQNGIIPSTIDG